MKTLAEIMSRISELLSHDGFRQPSQGIYVKTWDDAWRGWLAVDPGSHLLIPTVGVFSDEILTMRVNALKKLGVRWTKRSDGPPLIKINLHQLVGGDAEDRSKISWFYTGKELQRGVADDVVYCFRKKGYPYIEAHTNYAAILDAVMKDGRGTPALSLFLPMVLIKLRRLDYLSKLVDAQRATPVCEDMSISYEQYVNALRELEGI
jgi:hypothetical protein